MPTPLRVNAWLYLQAGLWLGILALPLLFGRPFGDHDRFWIYVPALFFSWLTLNVTVWPGLHVADLVTGARGFGMVGLVCAWPLDGDFSLGWSAILATLLGLDLLDGWIARATKPTEKGAWIDMETDQLAVLSMSLLASPRPGVGPLILVLPILRYAFVVAMFLTGRPAHLPKPVKGDNRRGRLICAAVITTLFLLVTAPLPEEIRRILTIGAVGLLAYSFAGDARHLLGFGATDEEAP